MSKTVDELVRVFEIAHYGAANGPADKTRLRAGIAAVIRALRDEIAVGDTIFGPPAVMRVTDLRRKFNEILGDAGEKVAGSTPEGAVLSSSAEGEPPANPATAPAPVNVAKAQRALLRKWRKAHSNPAPAVCVWIDQVKGMAWAGCDNKLYPIKSAVNGCNGCGLPIKFTEAKT